MSRTASGYRLKDSDYPAVPEKSGYTGTWTKYTAAIVSDIQVNATYKRTTPVPTVKPTGGVVASLTEEPTEPDVPPVEAELMEDLEPQESPAEQENTPTEPIATQAQMTTTHTVQHDYVTQSGRLVREKVTEDGTLTAVMDFVYDESGRPLALLYSVNGTDFTTYYYILNLQGDVVKLIGTDGTVAASYTYDAWGNILSSSGTMANINPLRYRGYYYDGETGFYYLQSRYYDPATRRFLNADSLASTGQGFVGTNMFAYCNNNPVRKEDVSGEDSATIDLTLGEQEERIEVDCFVVRVSVTVKYTDGYDNGKNGVNISTDLQGVSVGASVGKLTVSVYGGKFRPKFGIAIDGEYMGLSLDYYFSGGFGGTITYKKGKFTYEIEVEFRDIDSGDFWEAADTWVTRLFSYVIPPVVIWGKGELPSAKHTGGGYGINVLLAR